MKPPTVILGRDPGHLQHQSHLHSELEMLWGKESAGSTGTSSRASREEKLGDVAAVRGCLSLLDKRGVEEPGSPQRAHSRSPIVKAARTQTIVPKRMLDVQEYSSAFVTGVGDLPRSAGKLSETSWRLTEIA